MGEQGYRGTMGRRSVLWGLLPLGLVLTGGAHIMAQEAEPEEIRGFRSARFGMDEWAVRGAIYSDFGLADEAVRAVPNTLDGTTILSVEVDDLIQGAGTAQINYTLGFASRTLDRVDVIWGTPIDPATTPEIADRIVTLLGRYFDEATFAPGSVVRRRSLPSGAVLIFAAADAAGHAITLTYRRIAAAPEAAAEGEAQATPFILRLSYIDDPQNPDVFRLEEGAF